MLLRRLHRTDLTTRVKWLNDPLINTMMNLPGYIDPQGADTWFERVSAIPGRADLVLQKNNVPVAMTGLIPKVGNGAETYIFVDPGRLRKGIGTMTNFACMVFAFNVVGFDWVRALVDADNLASKKNYEKMGFYLDVYVKNGIEKRGKLKDRHHYLCNKTTFNKNLFEYTLSHERVKFNDCA